MKTEGPEFRPERGAATPVPTVEGEAVLARPTTRVPTCLVVIGGEQFAIDVRHLREVMIVEKLTAVPGAPTFLLGVGSLRGEVLAILDVACVLGLPPCGVGPPGKALVLDPASRQVAIVVDEVLGLETFDGIRPPEDPRTNEHAAFGIGWLERDGRPVTLLDIPKVVDELKVRSRAAGRRGAGARPSWASESPQGEPQDVRGAGAPPSRASESPQGEPQDVRGAGAPPSEASESPRGEPQDVRGAGAPPSEASESPRGEPQDVRGLGPHRPRRANPMSEDANDE